MVTMRVHYLDRDLNVAVVHGEGCKFAFSYEWHEAGLAPEPSDDFSVTYHQKGALIVEARMVGANVTDGADLDALRREAVRCLVAHAEMRP